MWIRIFSCSGEMSLSSPEKVANALFILFGVMSFFTREALSAQMNIIPSLTLREAYHSNITYALSEEKSDFLTDVSPRLQLFRRSERWETHLDALSEFSYYRKNDTLNTVDQKYDLSLSVHAAPRLKIGTMLMYKVDSRPDREMEETGMIFDGTERRGREGSASLKYIASEITTLQLSALFSDYQFDTGAYVDSWSTGVTGEIATDISSFIPATHTQIRSSLYRYDYDQTWVDTGSLTWGIDHRFSERISFFASGGPSLTKSTFSSGDREATSEKWGWVGMAGGGYQWETVSGRLDASRTVEHSSGWTGVSERSHIALSLDGRLSEKISWGTDGAFFVNQDPTREDESKEAKQETRTLSAHVFYTMSRNVRFRIRYSYSQTEYASDSHLDRHIFDLQLYLQKEMLEN